MWMEYKLEFSLKCENAKQINFESSVDRVQFSERGSNFIFGINN